MEPSIHLQITEGTHTLQRDCVIQDAPPFPASKIKWYTQVCSDVYPSLCCAYFPQAQMQGTKWPWATDFEIVNGNKHFLLINSLYLLGGRKLVYIVTLWKTKSFRCGTHILSMAPLLFGKSPFFPSHPTYHLTFPWRASPHLKPLVLSIKSTCDHSTGTTNKHINTFKNLK